MLARDRRGEAEGIEVSDALCQLTFCRYYCRI